MIQPCALPNNSAKGSATRHKLDELPLASEHQRPKSLFNRKKLPVIVLHVKHDTHYLFKRLCHEETRIFRRPQSGKDLDRIEADGFIE